MLPQPQPMVRMANGTYVPAQTTFTGIPQSLKRFLVVLQYWEGDKADCEDMASLIADLERIKNTNVDILIFPRADASPLASGIVSKLQSKFNKVITYPCRRKGAKGYPFGPNEMFYDLVTLIAQFAPFNKEYYAFINLESDCCPTGPGWIGKLIHEWDEANKSGLPCIGHIQSDHPSPHMNGVGVYSFDFWNRVPAGKLNGGAPHVAYDIYHGDSILKLAKDTPLIRLAYRLPTITADKLFDSGAVLFHGVKDGSARAIVRAKYVAIGDTHEYEKRRVFTFFNAVVDNPLDEKEVMLLWDQGWRSRGWNPIVLTMRDAISHPKYKTVYENISQLPCLRNRKSMLNRWMRWLALDNVGGGLMSEYDVLPAEFTPRSIEDKSCLGELASLVYLKKQAASELVDYIATYQAQPEDMLNGKANVDEALVVSKWLNPSESIVQYFGERTEEIPALIHFSNKSIESSPIRNTRKSNVMKRFLMGEI